MNIIKWFLEGKPETLKQVEPETTPICTERPRNKRYECYKFQIIKNETVRHRCKFTGKITFTNRVILEVTSPPILHDGRVINNEGTEVRLRRRVDGPITVNINCYRPKYMDITTHLELMSCIFKYYELE